MLISKWADEDLSDKPATPSKRLIKAFFARAFIDISRHERIIRRDAARWIFSENTDPFSFRWAVDVLELGFSVTELRSFAINVITQAEDANKQ